MIEDIDRFIREEVVPVFRKILKEDSNLVYPDGGMNVVVAALDLIATVENINFSEITYKVIAGKVMSKQVSPGKEKMEKVHSDLIQRWSDYGN